VLYRLNYWHNIVTCIPIARQRLGKYVPAVYKLQLYRGCCLNRAHMRSAPRPLLCNGAVNTPKTVRDNRRRYFPWCPCNIIAKKTQLSSREWRFEFGTPESRDMSLGAEELNSVDNNGKKGVIWCKENFMCDFKLQWDCCKSVARIRLVTTENSSVRTTVYWKVCRMIALYCL
jgi:hypothetical protein